MTAKYRRGYERRTWTKRKRVGYKGRNVQSRSWFGRTRRPRMRNRSRGCKRYRMMNRNDAHLYDLFHDWKRKWSGWHTVMTAEHHRGYKRRRSEKGELIGYKATTENLKKWCGRYDDGIYEWRKVGPRGGYRTVVYVGKTSSAGKGSLMRRIQCYTGYQSHKRSQISRALGVGFSLQARVLPCSKTKTTAEDMESRALSKFHYGWNY